MERCRYTPASKLGRYAALFFYPVISLVVAASGIWVLVEILIGKNYGGLVILLFPASLAFFLFRLSFLCFQFENRKIGISEEGFTLGGKTGGFYRWEEVCEAAVLAFGASASLEHYQMVICIFLKPKTTKVLQKLLRSYLYGVYHQDMFIIVDYSPDMIRKLSDVYPGIISDCRKEQFSI